MEATLQALGDILLKAVPTFVLVLLLHFYLKKVFFAPLEKVLKRRYAATEGARRQALESLQHAETKAAEYAAALREARAELYKEQEASRKLWRQEQEATAREARAQAAAQVQQAKASLEADAGKARLWLETESRNLAARIAATILNPRRSGV